MLPIVDRHDDPPTGPHKRPNADMEKAMKRIVVGAALASANVPALRDASRIAPYIFRIAHNRGVSHVANRIGP